MEGGEEGGGGGEVGLVLQLHLQGGEVCNNGMSGENIRTVEVNKEIETEISTERQEKVFVEEE